MEKITKPFLASLKQELSEYLVPLTNTKGCPEIVRYSKEQYRILNQGNKRQNIKRSDNNRLLKVRGNRSILLKSLLFYSNFIRALEHRGHNIVETQEGLTIQARDVNFGFEILEKEKRVYDPKQAFGSRSVGTGNITLKVYRRSWDYFYFNDSRKPLESYLPNIVAKIELEAEKEVEFRIKVEENHRIREEEKRKKQEEERKAAIEKAKVDSLFEMAHNWSRTVKLRAFINEVSVRRYYDEDWIKWANSIADEIDPLSKPLSDISATGGS